MISRDQRFSFAEYETVSLCSPYGDDDGLFLGALVIAFKNDRGTKAGQGVEVKCEDGDSLLKLVSAGQFACVGPVERHPYLSWPNIVEDRGPTAVCSVLDHQNNLAVVVNGIISHLIRDDGTGTRLEFVSTCKDYGGFSTKGFCRKPSDVIPTRPRRLLLDTSSTRSGKKSDASSHGHFLDFCFQLSTFHMEARRPQGRQ